MRVERRVQNFHRALVLALLTLFSRAASAEAQAPSRAARLLSLGADVPAVLIAPDEAWFPASTDAPLALCAGVRCAPVREVTGCEPPRCPGTGSTARAEHAVADVETFPTDREGFGREVERLRSDGALASLAWSYGNHPEPPPGPPVPARFSVDGQRGLRWELDAQASFGVLAASDAALVGGEVSGGFRYVWQPRSSDDEFMMLMFGNIVGADLRVRSFALMPSQTANLWAVSIGVGPSMGIAPEHEGFRLPSIYGSLLPEFGVILRPDLGPAWYAGWSLPVTVLLDPHLGVEMRATVLVVDDWVAGDDVEALLTLGVGLVVR